MNADFCVCINSGRFDVVLDWFTTISCAKQFINEVKPLCDYPIEIKPAAEVRELIVGYTSDRVITSVRIETGKEQ